MYDTYRCQETQTLWCEINQDSKEGERKIEEHTVFICAEESSWVVT